MRWQLTYEVSKYTIPDPDKDTDYATVTRNMEKVESDKEAVEKARVFLEEVNLECGTVRSYSLVRVVQEEITVPIKMEPSPRTYGELKGLW